MNHPETTLVGNLTDDPELRFTAGGAAVANFTIAVTPKRFDKQAGAFKDEETIFARCTAWSSLAENVAESLTKGTRVVAQVRIKSRSFETKAGEKRTVTEYDVEAIGPDLRYGSAKVTKADRPTGGRVGATYGADYGARPNRGAPQTDPWAEQQTDPWAKGGAADVEPPF